MKKYTTKQHAAISALNTDIDELDNKPRRLFSALRQFAKAFVEPQHCVDIVASIDEFEHMYYQFRRTPEYARDIFQSRNEALRELRIEKAKYNPDDTDMYDIEKALNLLTKKIVGNLTDV